MLPRMCLVERRVEVKTQGDIAGLSGAEAEKCLAGARLKPGDRVAIAVGSRGICSIADMVAGVVERFRRAGADPFVFPAMGCHGGGTSEGQRATLEHLGVVPGKIGCPVISDIEPVGIGDTTEGVPVYLDGNAYRADHLVVVNRVKPHSDFFGTIGSGLLKMLAIGCGKMRGAAATHEAAIEYGLEHMLRSVSSVVLQKTPVLGGLAVIEGPTGQTHRISWVPAETMQAAEPSMFAEACDLAPAIPLPSANLLVVDWMGKNISGCGMDPFVIGRQDYLNVHESYTDFRADRVYVRDLTDESLGNADGIGMADATSQRLVSKLDYDAIRIGVLTSRTLPLGRIPIAFPNDRAALEALLHTTNVPARDATVMRIRNTTDLHRFWISENLLPQWNACDAGRALTEPSPMRFDRRGNLLDWDDEFRNAVRIE